MDRELLRRHRVLNRLHSGLLLVAMAGLLALVGWLFAGGAGVVWFVMLAIVLAAMSPNVSPRFILRMYRARELAPGEAPGLHQVVAELARRAGLGRFPRLFYVASPVLNAFGLGGSEQSFIVVSDGMLRKLAPRELAGVLAHEISHVRNNDISVMGLADLFSRMTSLLSSAGQLLLFFNLPLILFSEYRINWWAIGVLIAAPVVSSLIQLALSRSREYDADIGAAELTGDPEGLANALSRIERYQNNVFEQIIMPGRGVPEPSILRTHPHTGERLRRLRSLRPESSSARLADPDVPDSLLPAGRQSSPRWRSPGMWY